MHRPSCGLLNPPDAQRCDCGYDFATGERRDSYLCATHGPGERAPKWLLTVGWVFCALGAPDRPAHRRAHPERQGQHLQRQPGPPLRRALPRTGQDDGGARGAHDPPRAVPEGGRDGGERGGVMSLTPRATPRRRAVGSSSSSWSSQSSAAVWPSLSASVAEHVRAWSWRGPRGRSQRTPEDQVGAPRPAGGAAGVARADEQIVQAIAVHVTSSGHRVARTLRRRGPQEGVIVQARTGEAIKPYPSPSLSSQKVR